MTKRPRDDIPHWWSAVEEEIRSNGGFISPKIHFSESTRELSVDEDIDKETLLMNVPAASLVSESRMKTKLPWFDEAMKKIEAESLSTSLIDLCIALGMSSQTSTELPYLATLPNSASFDALPRRWNDNHAQELLGGSPLLNRVVHAKQGVLKDYQTFKKAWEEMDDSQRSARDFPSFDTFSDMLAAVSSRAFGCPGSDSNVACVPILDLCDHCRGDGAKKNLSYQWNDDGSIEVKTVQRILKDENLRLTYGAQGNGQLLLNYGFTIPTNLEPDGSSNDALEFNTDGMPVIHLRTGPKSYTYGGLVKALESVVAGSDESGENGDEEDDMESFLNQCDEEEEMDVFNAADDLEEEDEDDDGGDEAEMTSLNQLIEVITKKWDEYKLKGPALKEGLSAKDKSLTTYFAALLIQSEQRTLYFFRKAAEKVKMKVSKEPQKVDENIPEPFLPQDDIDRIEKQTGELADVYMTIRHGGF